MFSFQLYGADKSLFILCNYYSNLFHCYIVKLNALKVCIDYSISYYQIQSNSIRKLEKVIQYNKNNRYHTEATFFLVIKISISRFIFCHHNYKNC